MTLPIALVFCGTIISILLITNQYLSRDLKLNAESQLQRIDLDRWKMEKQFQLDLIDKERGFQDEKIKLLEARTNFLTAAHKFKNMSVEEVQDMLERKKLVDDSEVKQLKGKVDKYHTAIDSISNHVTIAQKAMTPRLQKTAPRPSPEMNKASSFAETAAWVMGSFNKKTPRYLKDEQKMDDAELQLLMVTCNPKIPPRKTLPPSPPPAPRKRIRTTSKITTNGIMKEHTYSDGSVETEPWVKGNFTDNLVPEHVKQHRFPDSLDNMEIGD